MKKFISFITLCMLLICFPTHISANSPSITGYTQDGIFYEAITLEENLNFTIVPFSDTMSLTKEITYNGIITPKNSITWSETISGTTFSGTLYLQSFYYSNNKTIATYK